MSFAFPSKNDVMFHVTNLDVVKKWHSSSIVQKGCAFAKVFEPLKMFGCANMAKKISDQVDMT